jgi:hypothetical protein
VENQQQRPFPKKQESKKQRLTEQQIERKNKTAPQDRSKEVNAICFAPKVCER